MAPVWLLLAIVCNAKAPHACHTETLGIYPRVDWCASAVAFRAAYPQPRQIKVWCQRKENPA